MNKLKEQFEQLKVENKKISEEKQATTDQLISSKILLLDKEKENEALKKQVDETVEKVKEITKERDKTKTNLEELAKKSEELLSAVRKEKEETAVKLAQVEKERDEIKDENEQLAEYKTDYDNIQEISKKLEFDEPEPEPEQEPEPAIEQPLEEEQKPLNEVEAKLEREFATAEQLRRGENKICDFHYKDIDIKKHLNKLNLHNVSGHMGMTEVKIKNPIDLTKLNDNPWK